MNVGRKFEVPLLLLLAIGAQIAVAHPEIEWQLEAVDRDINAAPDDPALYVRRGDLKRLLRDWEGAEADFARAEQLGAGEIRDELPLHRARLFIDTGHFRRGLFELDGFIARHPDHIDARRLRAITLAQAGETDAAIADYSHLLQTHAANSPELWVERARLLQGTGHTEAAVAGIDEAIGIFGPLVTLVEFAIEARIDDRNYAAALDEMDRLPPALRAAPHWQWRRGEVLRAFGKSDAANQAYEEAVAAILKLPVQRQNTAAMQELRARLNGYLKK